MCMGFRRLRDARREILLETLSLFCLKAKIQSDGIEGEGGWRREARLPVPWMTTPESPNVPSSPLSPPS